MLTLYLLCLSVSLHRSSDQKSVTMSNHNLYIDPESCSNTRLGLGIYFIVMAPILLFITSQCFKKLVQIDFSKCKRIRVMRLVGTPHSTAAILESVWRLRKLPAGYSWAFCFIFLFYFANVARLMITKFVVPTPRISKFALLPEAFHTLDLLVGSTKWFARYCR